MRVETVVLAAQVVLAGVFIAAGFGKLFDLSGSRSALQEFGVPQRTAAVIGTLLPVAELSIAAALLLRPAAQGGGVAALALLLCFIAGISNALARGKTPDCNCFGALHSSRAGRSALGRNAALAVLAAFVAIRGPGPSLTGWVADRSAAELVAVAAGTAATVLTALSLRMWWQTRRLGHQLSEVREAVAAIPPGLPVGSMAPDLAVSDLGGDGDPLTLESLLAPGLPVALVFSRAGCGPSQSMLPDLTRWQDILTDRLTIGLVGAANVRRYEEGPEGSLADAIERDPVLGQELDDLDAVFDTYRVHATPAAVIVTAEGTIATATVDGRPAIEALLHLTLARAAPRSLHGLTRG